MKPPIAAVVTLLVPIAARTGIAQLADSAWPKFQHDLRNSGCSEHVGPDTPEVVSWSGFAGVTGGSQIVVDENDGAYVLWAFTFSDRLDARPDYFGRGDEERSSYGRLERFRSDGSLVWNRRIAPWGTASPCLSAGGHVYTGTGSSTYEGRAYAFSTSGPRLWRSDLLNTAVYTHPTVGPGGVMYYPTDGGLFAFAGDGTVLWRYSGLYQFQCPSIGADGTIYLGLLGLFGGGGVVALNPDGSRRWYTEIGGCNGTTLAENGTIYVLRAPTNFRSDLIALRPDGTTRWQHALELLSAAHPAVGSDGVIYVASNYESPDERGVLWAVNPDGTRKWTVEIPVGTYAPVVVDAAGNSYVVYYASSQPLRTKLVSFNAEGIERWTYALGLALAQTGPAINAKGQLLIYAQKEGDPEPAMRILTLGDAEDPQPPAIATGP